MARLETDPGSELSPEQEKVQELLRAAIIRQGDSESDAPAALALQEALAIGAELNIPADQVLAAYAEQQGKEARRQRRDTLKASLERRQRRSAVALGALAVFLGLQFLWIDPPNFPIHFLLVLPFVALAFFMSRFTVSEEQLDRAELLPVPGICRVCFRPASSVGGVYCARHRP